MPKIIEAIYEDGVFKPLEKVDLKRGEKVRVFLEERGIITESLIIELEKILKNLPKPKVSPEDLEEAYYAGKMLY
ncbi:MAG: antitoxin family protein [Archaeoglobaceae archaeon]